MIRIVYEWRLRPENISAFLATWRRTTRDIHATVKGARGSFLIRDVDDPNRILTVARWDSREEWLAFWQAADPEQMRAMGRLGRRLSVGVYEEYADFTV